ncbi:MAG: VPLPA-CTERM sorting domain-containing protein [Pseudomonadota bacterium]
MFKFFSAAALSASILACPAWAVTQTVTSDPFDLEDLGFSRDVSGGDIPLSDTDTINPFDPANGTLEQILLDLERVSSVDGTLTYEITVGGVVVFSETITDADNGSVSLLSSADITNLFTNLALFTGASDIPVDLKATFSPAGAPALGEIDLDGSITYGFTPDPQDPVAAVPLPAGLVLVLTGLVALGAVSRRSS